MVIGLTGGIGTGKSTVSQILREKKFPVIDLDTISHEVIKFPKVVEKIVENHVLSTENFLKIDPMIGLTEEDIHSIFGK